MSASKYLLDGCLDEILPCLRNEVDIVRLADRGTLFALNKSYRLSKSIDQIYFMAASLILYFDSLDKKKKKKK